MSQEANKFSVAFVYHFILGNTCGISAGWACCHQLPGHHGKTLALKDLAEKHHTASVKTVRCQNEATQKTVVSNSK